MPTACDDPNNRNHNQELNKGEAILTSRGQSSQSLFAVLAPMNSCPVDKRRGSLTASPSKCDTLFVACRTALSFGPGTPMSYWMGLSAWQAATVAAAVAPVGSLRITPDSSEQKERWPD